ncbi:MAG: cysteine desulfurase family protein [Fimbriiglobus sp.]
MRPIYLDWNATAPLRPEAWDAMRPAFADVFGNPASAHHAGRHARRLLDDARDRVAALLGAAPDEVIFTSGATEANNLAVFGLAEKSGHVLAAEIEHPCVVEPLRHLAATGVNVEWLPVTGRGLVETAAVHDRLRPDTRLVCVMLANHETGAIQPVRHVAKTVPKTVAVHCDAAQAVGKIPVNFRDLGAATLSASGHKFGGPKGIGLLLLRSGVKLTPRAFGGHQQRGHRPGTEPVALALGLAAALEVAVREMDTTRAKLDGLRRRLLKTLIREISPLVVNGPLPGEPDGLPTTLNLSFPGCRADVLLMRLDLAGVACSTGSACSSGSLLPSPVLRAMGVPDDVLRSAVRFSFGPTLTDADIDDAAERIATCVQAVRNTGPGLG